VPDPASDGLGVHLQASRRLLDGQESFHGNLRRGQPSRACPAGDLGVAGGPPSALLARITSL
jgi:hypothetical protein